VAFLTVLGIAPFGAPMPAQEIEELLAGMRTRFPTPQKTAMP
jgi:hypothetical protein